MLSDTKIQVENQKLFRFRAHVLIAIGIWSLVGVVLAIKGLEPYPSFAYPAFADDVWEPIRALGLDPNPPPWPRYLARIHPEMELSVTAIPADGQARLKPNLLPAITAGALPKIYNEVTRPRYIMTFAFEKFWEFPSSPRTFARHGESYSEDEISKLKQYLKEIAESEIHAQLGTQVAIGALLFEWFDRRTYRKFKSYVIDL